MPDLCKGNVDQGSILKKSIIAVPAAAVMMATGLGFATAGAASAAPTQAKTPAAKSSKSLTPKQKAGIQKKARLAGISIKKVKRYNIKNRHVAEIRAAKRWAKGSKPRSVRACESGGRYSINTGNGYYGAYQFAAGTWNGIGGGMYASHAHKAPKFAQDHMAYRLYKKSGWGPWGCA